MRILSIRGGGIKGVVPAMILSRLELLTGRAVAHSFDLIVGTSTGGIIALAAGLGMSAGRMRDLYVEQGAAIFRRRWLLGLFAARYDIRNLRSALLQQFGERMLGECRTQCMVTATDWATSGAVFFKSWQHRHLSVVDVASATAAAPTYFDPVMVGNACCVDGGLFANNPAQYALLEAVKAGRALGDIRLVDLACPVGPPVKRRPAGGVIGVLPSIVDALIDAGMDAAAHSAKKLLNGNCLTVVPELDYASPNMADASRGNIARLVAAGERQADRLAVQIAAHVR